MLCEHIVSPRAPAWIPGSLWSAAGTQLGWIFMGFLFPLFISSFLFCFSFSPFSYFRSIFFPNWACLKGVLTGFQTISVACPGVKSTRLPWKMRPPGFLQSRFPWRMWPPDFLGPPEPGFSSQSQKSKVKNVKMFKNSFALPSCQNNSLALLSCQAIALALLGCRINVLALLSCQKVQKSFWYSQLSKYVLGVPSCQKCL